MTGIFAVFIRLFLFLSSASFIGTGEIHDFTFDCLFLIKNQEIWRKLFVGYLVYVEKIGSDKITDGNQFMSDREGNKSVIIRYPTPILSPVYKWPKLCKNDLTSSRHISETVES